ncbi:hypothetical protein KP509_14G056200 [Ceratopteris richardii]|uniref:Pentatricopeptide repeat-containing protein n=1 Tax=Ceratopteris richardii TaxID=49495 RepID=A0A8T2TAC7_CERRI|nr:hypothetical protein KP509_14G056200 [Ceratopteris richardii]
MLHVMREGCCAKLSTVGSFPKRMRLGNLVCHFSDFQIPIDAISEQNKPLQNEPLLSSMELNMPTDPHIYSFLHRKSVASDIPFDGCYLNYMDHGNKAPESPRFVSSGMRRDCESGEDATGQFSETHYHMTEVWNSMMTIYMRQRSYPEAFHLFQKMLQEGIIPDMGTYISLLSVCAGLTSIVEGRHTHARIMGTGYYIDVFVSTSLVNLYGKFGESKCALQQFDAMPHRSTVTWNALISGYKQNKQCKQVLQLFGQILLECVLPSSATFACVLSACATEGLRFQVSHAVWRKLKVYSMRCWQEAWLLQKLW